LRLPCPSRTCATVARSSPAMAVTMPSLLSSPFSSRSGDHQDLHSFPTRRSSDLPAWPPMPGALIWLSMSLDIFFLKSLAPRYGRSEEHTSELQSRENLVCRLLLEKKKRRARRIRAGSRRRGRRECRTARGRLRGG